MIVYAARVDPAKLAGPFRADVEDLLGSDPDRWLVTYGYRSLEEQAALYDAYLAGGPRAAPPGKSAHNFGLAVDIVLDADPLTARIEADWDERKAGWVRIHAKIKAHSRLKSGVSFGDGGHVERYRWTRYVT